MTELEEAKERILKAYPDAYNIIPEPSRTWVRSHFLGGILTTGFDTWKCRRHGVTFAPSPDQMRPYRFTIKRPHFIHKDQLCEEYGHLIITDCPDPKCKDEPHKLCIFY